MTERTIRLVYDQVTGEQIDNVDQFFEAFEATDQKQELRSNQSKRNFIPTCSECHQELKMPISRYGKFFFQHRGDSQCWTSLSCSSNADLDLIAKSQTKKESAYHQNTKNKIGNLLNLDNNVDPLSVKIDCHFIDFGAYKLKPDVLCTFNGKPIAFEIQCSKLPFFT